MIIDFHTHTFPDKSSEKIVNHLAHIGCIPPHTDGSVIGLFSSMKEKVSRPLFFKLLRFSEIQSQALL